MQELLIQFMKVYIKEVSNTSRQGGIKMNVQYLKLNEVIIKKSHNSYERDESIEDQLSKFDDPEDCNCRGIELDLNFTNSTDPTDPNFFEVYHKSRSKDPKNLADYLSEVKNWHDDNPGHNFVFVALDLKDNTTSNATKNDISDPDRYPKQLDQYLATFFGEDIIFKPKDLLGDRQYSSLYEFISQESWPTLAEIGARFIFCVTGEWKSEYAISNSLAGLCFADYFVSGEDDEIPNFPIDNNILFYNCKIHSDADRDKWTKTLPHYQNHKMITRTYSIDSESLWNDALHTGVNILDTPKVSNYQWAKLQNGEAYIKQQYILWNKMNGTKYDTGYNPSVKVAKDGTIIEMHEGGNGTLYYNTGRITDDLEIEWKHFGVRYDTGLSPTVAVTRDQIIIEVHKGRESDNLYYRIGRLADDCTIQWIQTGTKYDRGALPTVAVTEDGIIIEIHNGGGNNNLYYNIGRLNDDYTIQWLHIGKKYDTGNDPTLAITTNGTLIEIHNGGGNDNLYYNIGRLNSELMVTWIHTGVKYDTGWYPSVTSTDAGTIVEIHNGEESNNLYYNIGRLTDDDEIEWECIGMKYDTGFTPTAAVFEDGTLIDIHNGGGNENLYYNIGHLNGYNSAQKQS